MHTIEVDFDVFKAITARRASESVTENDVLRDLFGLSRKTGAVVVGTGSPDDWTVKGVRFAVGTEFRAHYKGQTYLARVADRALVFNNERFDSPSAAAMKITGTPVNGWTFWECRMPGQGKWQPAKALRKGR